jgi:hypothetical protein
MGGRAREEISRHYFFYVRLIFWPREELLVFYRAPPLVADRGMLTRYGGYRGNKIPGADQN